MTLNFNQTEFLTSATGLGDCPPDEGAEVAFCGRSNAGKSSAINTLTGKRALARVSKTPGRTQLINFFTVNATSRLVDLPGYGYAKVPMSVRDHWNTHLDAYLRGRQSLAGLVLLMDIRHPPRPFDEMMIDWCATGDLPLHILLTKADKLKRGPQQSTLLGLRRSLPSGITIQVFSATSRVGVSELTTQLNQWLDVEAPVTLE